MHKIPHQSHYLGDMGDLIVYSDTVLKQTEPTHAIHTLMPLFREIQLPHTQTTLVVWNCSPINVLTLDSENLASSWPTCV